MVIGSNQTRRAVIVKNSIPDGSHSYVNSHDGYVAQNDYAYNYHANNTIALRDGHWSAGNECLTRRGNVPAVTTQPAAQDEAVHSGGETVGSSAAGWREAASSCCRCCDAGVPGGDVTSSATVLASYGVYGRRRHDADAAGNEDRDDESGFSTVVKYRAGGGGGGGATSTEVVRGGGGRRWPAWGRLSPPWGRRGRRAAIVALVTAALLAAVAALVAGLATVLKNSAQRPVLAYSGSSACPGDCPPELAPVCGNDGVTYRNLCQLRRRACLAGAAAAIRVAHVGQCGEELAVDPCASLECGPWSRCQVVGGAAACRCLPCPPPLSSVSAAAHVCGTDGRDYASECELRAAACRAADPRLTLRHRGKCDVCQGYKCPVLSTCHPDEQGRPQCRCIHSCHDTIESPVCGSDGTTYESECRMRMTSCEKQMIIVVTYKGPCDPCRGVVCAEPGAVCRSGVCACRSDCPRDARAERVCGSDGRSYRSRCRLQLASCRRPRGRPPITIAFIGDCRAADQETAVAAVPSTTASPVSAAPQSTVAGDYDVEGAHKVSKSTRHLALAELSHQQLLMPDAGPGLTSASLYRGLSDHPDTESMFSVVYAPTPATLSSLLGGACSTDGDCSVSGSVCLHSTCRCKEDRTPSHDRRHCLVYQVPSFDGQAFIEMKRLKAHNKLNIEIEFITYAYDGLLLYNQQKEDGTGDFVSLAIVQGHVEFRYNLGNGAVVLTSPERVTLGQTHTARARRYHRDGLLRVDDGPEVVGQSQGPLRALNLEENAYLGAVPTNHSRVFENVGTSRGLVGCVTRLHLGQQAVHLQEGGALVVRSSGVRQCGRSPCQHLPCQNGATCTPTGDDTFHCDCPPQFTGPYCESKTNSCAWSPCVAGSWCEVSPEGSFTCNCGPTSIKLPCHDFDAENQEAFVPEFDGNSFIELPKLEGVGKAFALELWFLTRTMDGVLLYSGQRLDGKGDYIALVLVSGHVQFHFELGSGPGKTVTSNGITPNQWHSVKVSYLDREGTLQLDDGPTAKGMSGAPLNELNLELPLYIGGLPATMYTGVVPLPNLVGAVQRLVVNGQILENLGEGAATVSRWVGPPCAAHTCLHAGRCQPRLNSFLCRCAQHYRGPRCQYVDMKGVTDSAAVKFTGNTYLKLSLIADASVNASMKSIVNETLVYNEEVNEHNIDITENDIYEHIDYDEEDQDNGESYTGDFQFKEEERLFSPNKQTNLENMVYQTVSDGETNERLFHYEVTFHTQETSGLILWNDRKTRHRTNFVALAISDGYLELRYRTGKTKYSTSLLSKVYVSDGRTHTVVAELHWKYSFLQVDDEHPKQKFMKANNFRKSLVQELWIESVFSAVYGPTPATLSSLLGGACSSDGDCSVSGSVCLHGTCRCLEDRTPSHDRRHCLVYQVPSFDGQAYIEMKRLKAHNKLNIEIEFITYAYDGLLLYNQQKEDGTGDFVSLAIVQGHVEFRYNLGNGAVVLTSPERVTLGLAHTARARRYHRDGLLRVDDGPEVVGQSQGPLRALNLEENAFLGAVPTNHSRVFENVGTSRGLVGCVTRLHLGQQAVHLQEGGALVVRSSGVRQCGRSPCQHLPCQNGATCTPTGDDTFHCDCPPQFTGPYCESKTNSCAWSPCVAGSWCEVSPEGGFTCNCGPTSIKLPCHDFDAENQEAFVPEFDGNSFIELPKLEGVGKAFALELWFLTRTMDGVLLYSGQRLDGKGDYIALVLVSGHVQFHFELGSGPGKTVTSNGITPNQWHSVKVSYLDREGTLQLDDGPTAKGMSGAPLNELNLELPLYIGGLPATMYTGVVPLPNLVGAVQRLVVNGQILENLGEGAATVARWVGPPCAAHTCLHAGRCQTRLNSFLCRCAQHYRGPRCQYLDIKGVTDSAAVKFTGNTYLKLSLIADASINASMKSIVNETLVYNEEVNEHNIDITENDIYEHIDYDEEDLDNGESYTGDFQFKEEDSLFSPSKQTNLENMVYQTVPDGETNERLFHYEVTFHTQETSGLILWNDRKTRHRTNFVALAISDGYLELRYRTGKTKYSTSLLSKVYVSDGRTHIVVAELHWKYSFLQVDDEHPKQKFMKASNFRKSLVQELWIGGKENLPSGLPPAYYSGFVGCMHRLVAQRELIDLYSGEASNMTLSGCHENEV